jgi:hypothetical protein
MIRFNRRPSRQNRRAAPVYGPTLRARLGLPDLTPAERLAAQARRQRIADVVIGIALIAGAFLILWMARDLGALGL